MANAASWTLDKLREVFNTVRADALAERNRVSTVNGKLVALKARAGQLRDPAKRRAAQAAVDAMARRQGRIAGMVREFNAHWSALVAALRKFTDSVHVPQLAGLGNPVIIVPAVIVGAVALAVAYVAKVRSENDLAEKELIERSKIVDAMLAGQISADEAARLNNTLDVKPSGGDVLGITDALRAAAPALIGLVAAAIFLPRVLDSLTHTSRA